MGPSFYSKSKLSGMEWRHKFSTKKAVVSANKVMATVLWDDNALFIWNIWKKQYN
jgi:hypothetical protein